MATPLAQDFKLNAIFSSNTNVSLENKILSGYLHGCAVTMILDSLNGPLNLVVGDRKINQVIIGNKTLLSVKRLSKTPFFLRRIFHKIAMTLNLGGYKDIMKAKAKTIADAYYAAISVSKAEKYSNHPKMDINDVSKDLIDLDPYDKKKEPPLLDKLIEEEKDVPCGHTEAVDIFNEATEPLIPPQQTEEDSTILDRKRILLEQIKNNVLEEKHIPEDFNDDKEIVLAFVKQRGSAILEASNKLRYDAEVAITAIRQNIFSYHDLPREVQALECIQSVYHEEYVQAFKKMPHQITQSPILN